MTESTDDLEHPEAGDPNPCQQAGEPYPGFQMFKADQRSLVVFDWSANALDCTFDGEKVFQVKKVEELAAMLTEPHKIVCEASFESFVPGRRQAMAKMLRDAGHELYTYRSTATDRYRRAHEIEKSNENDARVIYAIATKTDTHVHPLLPPDPEWAGKRQALNDEYFISKMSGLKPELYINPAKKILGRFNKLSSEDQLKFGNGMADKYSDSMLSVVYFATMKTTNRYDFERLIGASQSAYPSLLRSDLLHHGFKSINRKRDPQMTPSEFRRACRQLRSRFIAAGVGPAPEPEDDAMVGA